MKHVRKTETNTTLEKVTRGFFRVSGLTKGNYINRLMRRNDEFATVLMNSNIYIYNCCSCYC